MSHWIEAAPDNEKVDVASKDENTIDLSSEDEGTVDLDSDDGEHKNLLPSLTARSGSPEEEEEKKWKNWTDE